MYVLLAAVAILVTFSALGLAYFPVRLKLGRALGAPSARLFEVYWEGSFGRAIGVHGAALAAVWATAWAIATLGFLLAGEQQPTTRVQVAPGPAANAGIQDGDRVLAIDGHPVDDWSAVLAASKSDSAVRRFTVERAGQRLEISTTPDERGRVGIKPIYERRPLAFGEAAREGVSALTKGPLFAVEGLFTSRKVELAGPVAVVREARDASTQNSQLLQILPITAGAVWPGFIVLALLDALSAFAFAKQRPELRLAAVAEQDAFRLGRLWQVLIALSFLHLVTAAVGAAMDISAVGAGPVSSASFHWLVPSTLSVVFLIGSALRGNGVGALCVAALLVPCLGAATLVYLIVAAHRELKQRGIAVKGFRLERLERRATS